MLKKISSLAAGSYGYHSASRPLQIRRRSLDEDQLRRQSGNGRSDDSGTDGSQPEAEGLKNAMDMLIAENKHLKALIEERDARASSVNTAEEREEVEALRRDCTEAKDEAARLRQQLEAKVELIESMKRERALQNNEGMQELQDKIKSLEAQLEFECKNHAEELEEKEARIAELEMQLLDAQQKPSGEVLARQDELTAEEKQLREDLKNQLAATAAEVARKDAEISRLQAELESSREATADRKAEQSSSEDDERAKDLCRRIKILEAKLGEEETKRLAVEQSLARHRADAAENEEGNASMEDLRREIQEKDAALQGMKKDELEQQLQKLREAPSAPETPRALSSRRSFFGRSKSTALERDALASQVQQLEEQLQKLTEKRVELERTRVKLEGQLAEAVQDVRQARKEKSVLQDRLKEREAALDALRAAHADVRRPLDVPQNIVLPLPKGRQDAELEAKAQLVLKDGVIRTLSSRIAFLQFALKEVTAEKEELLAQPATVALQQQLQEVKKELLETSAKYRGVVNQRTELREKVAVLTKEAEKASREVTVLRAALDESQTRLTTTADKFKEQNDRYRNMVSASLSRIEELQDEVSRERNSKILVGKVYRQEMLELRKAAVHLGGVRGDPVRPLSSGREQEEQEQHQRQQQQQQSEKKQVEFRPLPNPFPLEKAPLPFAAEAAKQKPVMSFAPFGAMHGRTPTPCCPFSRGIPVPVTAHTQQTDFAVIPLCYPAETGAAAIETKLSEQQRQAGQPLHVYAKQHESSYTQGWQQYQAQPKMAAPPASQESSDVPRLASGSAPRTTTNLQRSGSGVEGAQTPSTPLPTEQERLPHQQLQGKQQTQHEQGGPQQEATGADVVQHRPPESTGAPKEPTDTQLPPSQQRCIDTSIPPQQHQQQQLHPQQQHLTDLHSVSGRRSSNTDRGSSNSSNSSSNSSSSSCRPSALRTQVSAGSDRLDAVAFSGDISGVPAAPSAPMDSGSLLRDLQQIQSKKKVLFTPGPGSRGPQEGPPIGENPFDADDDSIPDLS
ncbi:uncharacterized protein EMH_0096790 [Eimeria mitis]|uniref:Uncharacterized protein n=1 Tax=Eimeria mitis TaxID=44415 RepID=U6JWR1_9EIME|nr:uncharacterized protein EMH_0096790 [Eimeria mitis]CDJ27958.1 hypothetical protein, conserved [Eimeria mitis]